MWAEGVGGRDMGLETKSSQEICTKLFMTLSFPLVRNKSYLCHAFTCVLGITVFPKVPITENSFSEKQKNHQNWEVLDASFHNFFFVCPSACLICTLVICIDCIDHNKELWSVNDLQPWFPVLFQLLRLPWRGIQSYTRPVTAMQRSSTAKSSEGADVSTGRRMGADAGFFFPCCTPAGLTIAFLRKYFQWSTSLWRTNFESCAS